MGETKTALKTAERAPSAAGDEMNYDEEPLRPDCMLPPTAVVVDRAVLVEALEQIVVSFFNEKYDECCACEGDIYLCSEGVRHKPDCRYIRVRDALRAALELG